MHYVTKRTVQSGINRFDQGTDLCVISNDNKLYCDLLSSFDTEAYWTSPPSEETSASFTLVPTHIAPGMQIAMSSSGTLLSAPRQIFGFSLDSAGAIRGWVSVLTVRTRPDTNLFTNVPIYGWPQGSDYSGPAYSSIEEAGNNNAVIAIGDTPCSLKQSSGAVECYEEMTTQSVNQGVVVPSSSRKFAMGPHGGCSIQKSNEIVCWQWNSPDHSLKPVIGL